jgi:hypothetical protein
LGLVNSGVSEGVIDRFPITFGDHQYSGFKGRSV